MKLHYCPDTDSLYIELSGKPSSTSEEIGNDVVVDFDAVGDIVGIDIDHAAKKLDLRTLETKALPALEVQMT